MGWSGAGTKAEFALSIMIQKLVNSSARLFVVSLIIGLSACDSPRYFSHNPVDVTEDKRWWGELAKGEVFKLNQDALVSYGDLNTRGMIPTGNPGIRNGITVEQYKSDPDRYSSLGVRLVPTGTRLKLVKLERYFGPEASLYMLYAEILDGPLKGTLTSVHTLGDPWTKGTLRLNTILLDPAE
jgi:hypothetical protein